MVTVVQLVRASDCGSECRGFESHQSPSSHPSQLHVVRDFFVLPLSSRFPSFPVVRRLLFGTMRLLQRNAGACRCVRVASSAFCRFCSPRRAQAARLSSSFRCSVCVRARKTRASWRHRGEPFGKVTSRDSWPTKTCSLSRDLSALRAAAVLRFPPVNEFAPRARIYTRVRRFSFFCLHSFTVWHIGLVVNHLRVKGRVKSGFTFSVPSFTHRSEETSGQSGVNWAFFSPSSPFFAAHWLGVCACLQRGGVGAQRVKPFDESLHPQPPVYKRKTPYR